MSIGMQEILNSWGFRFRLTADVVDGEPAGFIWFENDRDAVLFLACEAPFLLPEPQTTQYQRHYELVDLAKDWLEPHPGYEIGEVSFARGLTQALDGILAIDWVGSFLQLCSGKGELECETRRRFFLDEGIPPNDRIPLGGDGAMARRFLGYCSRNGAKYWD
jgi:hypothetical protein